MISTSCNMLLYFSPLMQSNIILVPLHKSHLALHELFTMSSVASFFPNLITQEKLCEMRNEVSVESQKLVKLGL